MNDRIVNIAGELTAENLTTIGQRTAALSYAGGLPITFHIDSNGGLAKESYATALMVEALPLLPQSIETVAHIVNARSAASMFAIVAEKRLMLQSSSITLHLGCRTIEAVDVCELTGQLNPLIAEEIVGAKKRYLALLTKHMPLQNKHLAQLLAKGRLELTAEVCDASGYAKIVDSFD